MFAEHGPPPDLDNNDRRAMGLPTKPGEAPKAAAKGAALVNKTGAPAPKAPTAEATAPAADPAEAAEPAAEGEAPPEGDPAAPAPTGVDLDLLEALGDQSPDQWDLSALPEAVRPAFQKIQRNLDMRYAQVEEQANAMDEILNGLDAATQGDVTKLVATAQAYQSQYEKVDTERLALANQLFRHMNPDFDKLPSAVKTEFVSMLGDEAFDSKFKGKTLVERMNDALAFAKYRGGIEASQASNRTIVIQAPAKTSAPKVVNQAAPATRSPTNVVTGPTRRSPLNPGGGPRGKGPQAVQDHFSYLLD